MFLSFSAIPFLRAVAGGAVAVCIASASTSVLAQAQMRPTSPHPSALQTGQPSATSTLGPDWHLREFTPWLVKNSGPKNAKGAVLFIRGFGIGPVFDDFHMVPYFIRTLSENGWDVIGAKVPYGSVDPATLDVHDMGVATARYANRRIRELKAQGYRRVVLGGHSWGAWVALYAGQVDSFGADALLFISPNGFGSQPGPNGKFNPAVGKNLIEYNHLIPGIRTPTVLTFSGNDDYTKSVSGTFANDYFAKAGIPHLVIDKPPGFSGHFGGWLPVFDYAFGSCILSFLNNPATSACPEPPLSSQDFRSILNIRQVANSDSRRIRSADALVGKTFAAYELNNPFAYYSYKSATERDSEIATARQPENISFRDGLQCAANDCSILVNWSDRQLLEFEPGTGNLKAWWVQEN